MVFMKQVIDEIIEKATECTFNTLLGFFLDDEELFDELSRGESLQDQLREDVDMCDDYLSTILPEWLKELITSEEDMATACLSNGTDTTITTTTMQESQEERVEYEALIKEILKKAMKNVRLNLQHIYFDEMLVDAELLDRLGDNLSHDEKRKLVLEEIFSFNEREIINDELKMIVPVCLSHAI